MQLDDPKRPQRLRRCIENPVIVKDEAARRIGLGAVDAFDQLVSGIATNHECFDRIAGAMSSSEAFVSVAAAELMNVLAGDHAPARDLIWRLVHEGNEHARFSAMAAVSWRNNLPRAFVIDVLRVGLADASLSLRMNAAHDAAKLRLGELVPAMLEVRKSLPAPDAADWPQAESWLDLYIDLARDGYSLEEISEEEADDLRRGSEYARGKFQGKVFKIDVRLEERPAMTGGYASEAELHARGAAAIAEEIRQRFLEGERRRFPPATGNTTG